MIYCLDTSVLDTTRKIHKNYIREPSGLFSSLTGEFINDTNYYCYDLSIIQSFLLRIIF